MQSVTCTMTVFFEPPYWVAVIERVQAGQTEACKVTFGAEPKDYEVYAFVLERWHTLAFSPPVDGAQPAGKRAPGPKRMQRAIRRVLQAPGAGTKAQAALKMQQEARKAQHKSARSMRKAAQSDRRFALKQQKKREKRKGH